jgi:sulfatase maturation enzyme AslB (radical SAM superfamily)
VKLRILERSLKNLVLRAEHLANRRAGREFIPAFTETFCIEVSGACNLKCRFCAYEKKTAPRVNMTHDIFVFAVAQALDLGYREFHLTPCTGDVFMDPRVFDKFAYLEANERVRAYHFFTNLTILDAPKIEQLLKLKKLSRISISIYGHDEASFVALTKASPRIYRRLLANMDLLLARRAEWPFSVGIGFRSTFDVPAGDGSDLLRMIRRYREAGVGVHSSHGIYNNWGGYVSQADVGDLNLHIVSSDSVYKSGACVKLFDSFQVTASGVVNGCSCRDVDSTLRIGDLNDAPLRQILSLANPEYLRLIEEQQEGEFRPVCRSCDYYRSIYHLPSNFRRNRTPTQTMAQFFGKLERTGR